LIKHKWGLDRPYQKKVTRRKEEKGTVFPEPEWKTRNHAAKNRRNGKPSPYMKPKTTHHPVRGRGHGPRRVFQISWSHLPRGLGNKKNPVSFPLD